MEGGVYIACTACDETGKRAGMDCEECSGEGHVVLSECPRTYVGNELTEAINVASLCGEGVLPVAGGLLDQSSWFLSLWQSLKSEESKIEAEQMERASNGVGR